MTKFQTKLLVAFIVALFGYCGIFLAAHLVARTNATFIIVSETQFSHPELRLNGKLIAGYPNMPEDSPRRIYAWTNIDTIMGIKFELRWVDSKDQPRRIAEEYYPADQQCVRIVDLDRQPIRLSPGKSECRETR